MFPKFTGPELANHCYKMNAKTRQWDFEQVEISRLFFGNPTLTHIIVPRNELTNPIMQAWGAHLSSIPSDMIPLCQVRFVLWLRQSWHIVSTDANGMYDLIIHFEAHEHEIVNEAPQQLNSEGYLELFPFHGPNFWTARQPVLKLV
jgi:hypothetical protein